MNKKQYLYLQKYFHSHKIVGKVVHFFAMQIVVLYVLLPFFLVWSEWGREFIIASGLALVVSWGMLVQLIAFLYPTARPYQQYEFVPAGGSGLFSDIDIRRDSFPSGHVTALLVLTLIMFLSNISLAWVSLLVVVLVAIARVLLGYHYVRDMFGGLILAVLVIYVLHICGIFGFIFAMVS